MPLLQNPRHEAFAVSRVAGAWLEEAYEDAGFGPDKAHACRLAKRPEVAERIAELLREREEANAASPQAIIAALVRIAKSIEDSNTPASVKEARLNLLEAYRLNADLALRRSFDRTDIQRAHG